MNQKMQDGIYIVMDVFVVAADKTSLTTWKDIENKKQWSGIY